MKACFWVKGDQKLENHAFLPFEVLKTEWMNQIGQKTADGDLVLEVRELSKDEIEIIIEVMSLKTRKMLGGEKISVSLSFQ